MINRAYAKLKSEQESIEQQLIAGSGSYVKFLNHSSIILVSGATRILCDPWFVGTAFSDGWSLLFDDSHDINSLNYDYIWISHEHPDHFSIPTLSRLNGPRTFLFQETRDKKVKSYLERKGHTVIELENKQPTVIGDITLTCISCDGYDSSLIAKFPDGKVVVNINDARVDLGDHLDNQIIPGIAQSFVNLLMFQFSYANWAGNTGDVLIPRHQQRLIDQKNSKAIEKINPKCVMPFASFVYFSHEENFYWNESKWLDHVTDYYSSDAFKLVLPSPNQVLTLDVDEPYDVTNANEVSRKFWADMSDAICVKTKSRAIGLSEMEKAYHQFIGLLHSRNSVFSRLNGDVDFTIKLAIVDLGVTVEIGLFRPCFELSEDLVGDCCASISGETFDFLMRNAFGRGTVTINGRIQFNYDYAHRFFLFFFVFYANNIDQFFDESSVISYDLLSSINRTSVMMSILEFNERARLNSDADIRKLSDMFSPV